MKTILVLAGLPADIIDGVRKISSKRFVPHGNLLFKPLLQKHYSDEYNYFLVKKSFEQAVLYQENERLSVIIGFVNLAGSTSLLQGFFPYALPFELVAFSADWSRGKNSRGQSINDYVDYLASRCRHAIDVAGKIKQHVDLRNLTPLLLPKTNFRSLHLNRMLSAIFSEGCDHPNPDSLVRGEVERFLTHHPYQAPDGEMKRCLSDGILHFKSPGNNRHGFLRNSEASKHPIYCLLNARSRLGSPYDHTFHYDCSSVRGSLASSYPNCHDVKTAPKRTHVNIAPNDYII